MKKYLCVLMACVMILTTAGSVWAAGNSAAQIEAEIVNEIQMRESVLAEEVYRQLEAQDRTEHLNTYLQLLRPQIEQEVRMEYYNEGLTGEVSTNSTTTTCRYGAALSYEVLGTTALCTYLDFDDSYYYVIGGSSSMWDYISNGLSLNPDPNPSQAYTFLGHTLGILALVSAAMSSIAKSNILDAEGYAEVLAVNEGGSNSIVVLGWTNYPNVTWNTPTTSNAMLRIFADINPFEE